MEGTSLFLLCAVLRGFVFACSRHGTRGGERRGSSEQESARGERSEGQDGQERCGIDSSGGRSDGRAPAPVPQHRHTVLHLPCNTIIHTSIGRGERWSRASEQRAASSQGACSFGRDG